VGWRLNLAFQVEMHTKLLHNLPAVGAHYHLCEENKPTALADILIVGVYYKIGLGVSQLLHL
jgi:hypothetical protein